MFVGETLKNTTANIMTIFTNNFTISVPEILIRTSFCLTTLSEYEVLDAIMKPPVKPSRIPINTFIIKQAQVCVHITTSPF